MRVSVEGNIGSGKTTILRALAPELRAREEPLSAWGDLLDEFYADIDAGVRPSPSALPFSLAVLAGFVSDDDDCDTVTVYERSPATCLEVFTRPLVDDGVMTPKQLAIFKKYYDILAWQPDLIVYVDTPPDVCLARIAERGRACETNIGIAFLKRIQHSYARRLAGQGRIVTLDGTLPRDELLRLATAAIHSKN